MHHDLAKNILHSWIEKRFILKLYRQSMEDINSKEPIMWNISDSE